MKTRQYTFTPDLIGNIALGRPNLGNLARVEIYRLFQYTLRDILERKMNTEAVDQCFYDAGFLSGQEFAKIYIGDCETFSQFVANTQAAMQSMRIGILRIEKADIKNLSFELTVCEDLDCSGLPITGYEVCHYDEGFIAGLFFAFTKKTFIVRETECWCTGGRTCRFSVELAPDKNNT